MYEIIRRAAIEVNAVDSKEVVKVAGVMRRLKNVFKRFLSGQYADAVDKIQGESTVIQSLSTQLNESIEELLSSIKDGDVDAYDSNLRLVKELSTKLTKEIAEFQRGAKKTRSKIPGVAKQSPKEQSPAAEITQAPAVEPEVPVNVSPAAVEELPVAPHVEPEAAPKSSIEKLVEQVAELTSEPEATPAAEPQAEKDDFGPETWQDRKSKARIEERYKQLLQIYGELAKTSPRDIFADRQILFNSNTMDILFTKMIAAARDATSIDEKVIAKMMSERWGSTLDTIRESLRHGLIQRVRIPSPAGKESRGPLRRKIGSLWVTVTARPFTIPVAVVDGKEIKVSYQLTSLLLDNALVDGDLSMSYATTHNCKVVETFHDLLDRPDKMSEKTDSPKEKKPRKSRAKPKAEETPAAEPVAEQSAPESFKVEPEPRTDPAPEPQPEAPVEPITDVDVPAEVTVPEKPRRNRNRKKAMRELVLEKLGLSSPPIPLQIMPMTELSLAEALAEGYRKVFGQDPSLETLGAAWAQAVIERHPSLGLRNYNIGNIKADKTWINAGKPYFVKDTIEVGKDGKEYKESGTKWRAYPTAADGAAGYWNYIGKQHQDALEWMAAGDAKTATALLGQQGYYTANVEEYSSAVGGLYNQFRKKIAPKLPGLRSAPTPRPATEMSTQTKTNDPNADADQLIRSLFSSRGPVDHLVKQALLAEKLPKSSFNISVESATSYGAGLMFVKAAAKTLSEILDADVKIESDANKIELQCSLLGSVYNSGAAVTALCDCVNHAMTKKSSGKYSVDFEVRCG